MVLLRRVGLEMYLELQPVVTPLWEVVVKVVRMRVKGR